MTHPAYHAMPRVKLWGGAIDQAEHKVTTCTEELRTYLENILCPKSSNAPFTATTN